MIELFFFKRFLIQTVIPYSILILSVGYLIFELMCPKNIKEHFYIYSDKLYFKFIRRPFEIMKRRANNLKLILKSVLKSRILKKRERKQIKEKKKKRKELQANEKSKIKLNKRIDKVNKKIDKANKKINKRKKRALFIKCLFKKLLKITKKQKINIQ